MNCPTRDPEPTGAVLLSSFTARSLTGHLGNPGFNQSPPSFDRALVPRSSAVCGGGGLKEDEYNLGLHVMALFVILGQSTLGMFFWSFQVVKRSIAIELTHNGQRALSRLSPNGSRPSASPPPSFSLPDTSVLAS
jgi:hypothetical protein